MFLSSRLEKKHILFSWFLAFRVFFRLSSWLLLFRLPLFSPFSLQLLFQEQNFQIFCAAGTSFLTQSEYSAFGKNHPSKQKKSRNDFRFCNLFFLQNRVCKQFSPLFLNSSGIHIRLVVPESPAKSSGNVQQFVNQCFCLLFSALRIEFFTQQLNYIKRSCFHSQLNSLSKPVDARNCPSCFCPIALDAGNSFSINMRKLKRNNQLFCLQSPFFRKSIFHSKTSNHFSYFFSEFAR